MGPSPDSRKRWWSLSRLWHCVRRLRPRLRLSWWFWSWSEQWPVVQFLVFVRGLPLFGLWALAAYFLWLLIRNLTGLQLGETPAIEVATLLISLFTAAVGFGIQQWNQMEDYQNLLQVVETAEEEIGRLAELIQKRNYAEAARLYQELSGRREREWRTTRVRYKLKKVWEKAPLELRDVVDFVEKFEEIANLSNKPEKEQAYKRAVRWGYENLDDFWRQKLRGGLINEDVRKFFDGELLRQIGEEERAAVLRPWKQLTFWRSPWHPDPLVERALTALGIEDPFRPPRAEQDHRLWQEAYFPPNWLPRDLAVPWAVVGAEGSGKTAAALYLIQKSFRARRLPIYLPLVLSNDILNDVLAVVAQAVADTLMWYLAVRPDSLDLQDTRGWTATAWLFKHFVGLEEQQVHFFYLAGWPDDGWGAAALERFRTLGPVDHRLPSGETLASLVRSACPPQMDGVSVFVDVQEVGDEVDACRALDRLADAVVLYARAGVTLHLFLPEEEFGSCFDLRSPALYRQGFNIYVTRAEWTPETLKKVLESRIKEEIDREIDSWCDPNARAQKPGPSARLTRSAKTPRALMEAGHRLLARIGERTEPGADPYRLTVEDLDELLGPLVESEETG